MKIAVSSDEHTELVAAVLQELQDHGHQVSYLGPEEGETADWPVERGRGSGRGRGGGGPCRGHVLDGNRSLHRRQQGSWSPGGVVRRRRDGPGGAAVQRRKRPGSEPSCHLAGGGQGDPGGLARDRARRGRLEPRSDPENRGDGSPRFRSRLAGTPPPRSRGRVLRPSSIGRNPAPSAPQRAMGTSPRSSEAHPPT
jgi:hypothetical protein